MEGVELQGVAFCGRINNKCEKYWPYFSWFKGLTGERGPRGPKGSLGEPVSEIHVTKYVTSFC